MHPHAAARLEGPGFGVTLAGIRGPASPPGAFRFTVF